MKADVCIISHLPSFVNKKAIKRKKKQVFESLFKRPGQDFGQIQVCACTNPRPREQMPPFSPGLLSRTGCSTVGMIAFLREELGRWNVVEWGAAG
jgi:hypothetical protein